VLRVQSKAWAAADLLIVTDGLLDTELDRFDRQTLRLVERARRGTPFRIHVALARPSMPGIAYCEADRWVVHELADEIHDLEAWVGDLLPTN